MKGNYEPDNFTENDVLTALDNAGLKHGRGGGRYILSQCPLHDDKHESAQIYTDDWFVKCHAGCEGGRFHITKAFPELRPARGQGVARTFRSNERKRSVPVTERKYTKVDLMEYWKSLPEIPADHYFKNIPIEYLNDLGWRWDAEHQRYFIPYFSRSKTSIPFAQWRNLKGDIRFNFWKDAKPTIYGTWNLWPGEKLFLVEGTSDAAVLEHCAIPWIAAPSAASGELVKQMATWCKENDVELVYAGDNDAAGEKLREALDQVTSYRVRQPRQPNKDWGDMFEAEGIKSVINWCHVELFPGEEVPFPEIEPGYQPPEENVASDIDATTKEEKTDVQKVLDVFPDAKVLEVVGEKEQTKTPTVPPPPF